jgi:hypothetical protein
MAGREVGGAESARSDLFQGRAWIIDSSGVDGDVLLVARELIAAVGADLVERVCSWHLRWWRSPDRCRPEWPRSSPSWAFRSCSPVGAYLYPLPAPMPCYGCELRMAGGTFVDGTTTEFSVDAPLREP